MFEKIKLAIDTYNDVLIAAGIPSFVISIERKASPEEITALETAAGIEIPADLRDFYTHFGALTCDPFNENNSIMLFSPKYLLDKLNSPDKWSRTPSLGLIDMIKLNWANDRFEFAQELDIEILNFVNTNYFSFGTFNTDDNLESSHYLYFDRQGKFGYVFYHQDTFHELVDDYLKPMSIASPATQQFEDLIAESIHTITALKIEELK